MLRTSALLVGPLCLAALLLPSLARAQGAVDGPPDRANVVVEGKRAEPDEPPLAPGESPPPRRGLQLGLRLGPAIPVGKIRSGAGFGMSSLYDWEGQLGLDIGLKPWDAVYLGAGVVAGIGSAGSDFCGAISPCRARSVRLAPVAIYSFAPGGRVNPWIGVGVGWEWSSVSAGATTISTSGPELARVLAGVDFRLSRGFGIGPVLESSLGLFTSASREDRQSDMLGNTGLVSRDIALDEKRLHGWLTMGLRVIANP
jgi:hypothetical protein